MTEEQVHDLLYSLKRIIDALEGIQNELAGLRKLQESKQGGLADAANN